LKVNLEKMADLMTTNLHLELEKTNQAFSKWADGQVNWLDAAGSNFTEKMEENECTILSLKNDEANLESSRELNNTIKLRQIAELEQYTSQIERFKQQKKTQELQLRKLEEEEQKEINRLEAAQAEMDILRQKREQTLNDLTIGIKLYAALGLEFTKTEGDCMKFAFTNVDPKEPLCQFYFSMFVDENDVYQFVDSSPAVSPEYYNKQLDVLNTDNDIGKFVVNMRRYFRRLV
jgi:hypothetical protein